MRQRSGWWIVVTGLVFTATTRAWASSCFDVMRSDFIGVSCSNVQPGIGTETGDWILDAGGIFSGQATLEDTGSLSSRVRKVTRDGVLESPTFQGSLTSTTTRDSSDVVTFHEVRKGQETSAQDGSVFTGSQTTDVTDNPGSNGTGTPVRTITIGKGGTLVSSTFSGKLNAQSFFSRQGTTVLKSTRTTSMDGTWTITPTSHLTGTLVISIVNGTTTIQDNRVPS